MKRFVPFLTMLISFVFFLSVSICIQAASFDDVMNDAKDGTFTNVSLIEAMLIASNASSSEVSQLSSKADSKVSQLSNGAAGGSAAKQVDSILKNLKAKVLKQYWPGSTFQATLNEGKFDPLWGTGLLLHIMNRNKIPCKVIETPANFIVSAKDDDGSEVLFDIFAGKNPIKSSFADYISKTAGLRSSFQVKNFPPFSLNSAKRSDCSRLIVGVLQKRLIRDIGEDDFSDYMNVFDKISDTFGEVIIDQDKLVETLSKKLNTCEDPKIAIPLIKAANKTNRKVKVNTKEMNDNAILSARKTYLAIKAQNDWRTMGSYLNDLKPLVPSDVYTPMAKEGYLNIFNEYWKQKDYPKAEIYAKILCKDLRFQKACPFLSKAQLIGAQDLAKNNKFDEALVMVNKILKQNPNEENAIKIREFIYKSQYNRYKEQNRYPDMLAALKKLRAYHPGNEDYQKMMINTYWTWGRSYLEQGNFNKGIEILANGHKVFPDYEPLTNLLEGSYYNNAVSLAQTGKLPNAIDQLKKANSIFGEDNDQRNGLIADLYLKLSINAANKGDRGSAMSYCEKGLIYDPDNQSLKNQQDNIKRGKDSIEEEAIEFAPWE